MARRQLRQSDIEDARNEGLDESGWLVTLGDMMSLLLTFFVMLFAITSPTEEKYLGMLQKIGDALGGKSFIERQAAPIEDTREEIEKYILDNNLARQVNLTHDSRGLVMFAEGDLFFDAGSAQLKGEVKRFLKYVAGVLKKTQYKVIVEGHTDDTPTKAGGFPSNWELSSARASAVVRYFTDDEQIEPRRFSAIGYAQYKPRYALIPENRPKNRRVEIIIVREKL